MLSVAVESSDGEATSIPNRVALLVTKSNGEQFLASSPEEVDRFPATKGDRIEIPARKSLDLSFWYRAPWLLDCRLQEPGDYTVQLITGADPGTVFSPGATGLLFSNETRLRVVNPVGDDAEVYRAWKSSGTPNSGTPCWFQPMFQRMVWETYPDSTYAMYFLPSASDPMSLQEQIGLFRESLRRWPDSPVIESVRRDLAAQLIMLTGQSLEDRDLAAALASARESQTILTDLLRNANDPVIRKEAADKLENRAYTEQEVLDEFSGKRNILIPFVECVEPTVAGMRAWFGVANQTGQPKSIPAGPKNKLTPAPHDRGQLTNFPQGIRHLAFSVEVDGPVLDWHLDGTNVQAMLDKSFHCPPNMDEYLKDLPRKD